jgi:hypothetical protein
MMMAWLAQGNMNSWRFRLYCWLKSRSYSAEEYAALMRKYIQREYERDALLVALQAVEWVNQDDGGYGSSCPWCNWYAWNGHSNTCIRQFAIAKAKGE